MFQTRYGGIGCSDARNELLRLVLPNLRQKFSTCASHTTESPRHSYQKCFTPRHARARRLVKTNIKIVQHRLRMPPPQLSVTFGPVTHKNKHLPSFNILVDYLIDIIMIS